LAFYLSSEKKIGAWEAFFHCTLIVSRNETGNLKWRPNSKLEVTNTFFKMR